MYFSCHYIFEEIQPDMIQTILLKKMFRTITNIFVQSVLIFVIGHFYSCFNDIYMCLRAFKLIDRQANKHDSYLIHYKQILK